MGNAGARYYSTMDGTGHILITMNATVLSGRSQFLYKNTHLTRAHCCGVLVVYTTTDSVFCPDSKLVFIPILEPGQGFRDKSPRVFCPGWQNRNKMSLMLKIFLHPAGFNPKASCLAHDFLANSPK